MLSPTSSIAQFWIASVGGTSARGNQIVVTEDNPYKVEFFQYPAGGRPFASIIDGFEQSLRHHGQQGVKAMSLGVALLRREKVVAAGRGECWLNVSTTAALATMLTACGDHAGATIPTVTRQVRPFPTIKP